MKIKQPWLCFWLWSLIICAVTVNTVTSCKTDPATAIYRVSGTARIGAEAAMRSWGNFVALNHPPVAQELRVQKLFDSYKAAQVALLDAAIAYSVASTNVAAQPGAQAQLDRAVAVASSALRDLTALLASLGVKLEE